MSQEKGSWHQLCEAVSVESDPGKVIELVQQLIIALDERKTKADAGPKATQANVTPLPLRSPSSARRHRE
jgi:hypothetical protein